MVKRNVAYPSNGTGKNDRHRKRNKHALFSSGSRKLRKISPQARPDPMQPYQGTIGMNHHERYPSQRHSSLHSNKIQGSQPPKIYSARANRGKFRQISHMRVASMRPNTHPGPTKTISPDVHTNDTKSSFPQRGIQNTHQQPSFEKQQQKRQSQPSCRKSRVQDTQQLYPSVEEQKCKCHSELHSSQTRPSSSFSSSKQEYQIKSEQFHPRQLFHILEDETKKNPSLKKILSWAGEGCKFAIHDWRKFVDTILVPNVSIWEFVQTLCDWGFTEITGSEDLEFLHPYFREGDPSDLGKMKKKENMYRFPLSKCIHNPHFRAKMKQAKKDTPRSCIATENESKKPEETSAFSSTSTATITNLHLLDQEIDRKTRYNSSSLGSDLETTKELPDKNFPPEDHKNGDEFNDNISAEQACNIVDLVLAEPKKKSPPTATSPPSPPALRRDNSLLF